MKNKSRHYYDKNAALYDKILSPVEKTLSKWRKSLLKDAAGKTLEIGVGTGKSITDYPHGVTVTAIDSSKNMLKYARQRAIHHTHIDNLIEMDAEELAFDDNSFDSVVAACVFCSVRNPIKAFTEMRRVCKEGGHIYLLEHVRSQHKVVGKVMDILNPISYHLYGDNINRNTYDNLLNAGFDPSDITIENVWWDIWQIYRIHNHK